MQNFNNIDGMGTNRQERQKVLLTLLEDVQICNGTKNELRSKLDAICKEKGLAIFDENKNDYKSLSFNTLNNDLITLEKDGKLILLGHHYYAKHTYEMSKLAFGEYQNLEINNTYNNLQLSIWELKRFQNIENIQEILSDIYKDCYIECTEEALYIYHPSSQKFDEKMFRKTLKKLEELSLYYWHVPNQDKKKNK